MRWFVGILGLVVAATGCSPSLTRQMDEADEYYAAAAKASAAGNKEEAIDDLDASIAARPTAWAYALRGRLHAELGHDEQAGEDVRKGLGLDAENQDLLWLQRELEKPKNRRFRGPSGADRTTSK